MVCGRILHHLSLFCIVNNVHSGLPGGLRFSISQFRHTRSPVWICVRAASATISGVKSRNIPRPSSSDPCAAGQYRRLSGRSSNFSGRGRLPAILDAVERGGDQPSQSVVQRGINQIITPGRTGQTEGSQLFNREDASPRSRRKSVDVGMTPQLRAIRAFLDWHVSAGDRGHASRPRTSID